MDGVQVMKEIGKVKDELGNKIDATNKHINDVVTELRVYNQKNEDSHNNFDKRLCDVEEFQYKKVSTFNNLFGMTPQAKMINVIIILAIIIAVLVGIKISNIPIM